ncbi:MAG: hypothetical protein NXI18_18485 [Alphaproteobacteria bacterium]|nr:hypothetical protein [Alphaproteobacteria bacterium]
MLHQPLPQYLNKLNQDDDALRAFLADPIKEADAANLSKAERAVLRRVVTTGSNGSVNGYSIVKPLAAYRQAVQLMQNVIHNNMGGALASGAGADHTVLVYLQQQYANNLPHYPNGTYSWCQYFYGNGDTIGEVMDDIAANNPNFSYTNLANDPSTGQPLTVPIIKSFTTYGTTYTAPPTATAGVPFWFWSVDGKASPTVIHGSGANKSYYDHQLQPGQTIVWQIIAPTKRGFPHCELSDGTHARALA